MTIFKYAAPRQGERLKEQKSGLTNDKCIMCIQTVDKQSRMSTQVPTFVIFYLQFTKLRRSLLCLGDSN